MGSVDAGGRQRRSRCLGAWDCWLRESRLPGSAAALLSTRFERRRCGSLSACGGCRCVADGSRGSHAFTNDRWPCRVTWRSGPRLVLLLGGWQSSFGLSSSLNSPVAIRARMPLSLEFNPAIFGSTSSTATSRGFFIGAQVWRPRSARVPLFYRPQGARAPPF